MSRAPPEGSRAAAATPLGPDHRSRWRPLPALVQTDRRQPSAGWSHSVIIESFRWRQVIRSGPPGEAVKPWTSPAGTTTTEPPRASIVSSPARNEPDPSCSTKTSAYGWLCGPGPWPGGLAWMKNETGTPPWSRPRNVRDSSSPGRSAFRMWRATPPPRLVPHRRPSGGSTLAEDPSTPRRGTPRPPPTQRRSTHRRSTHAAGAVEAASTWLGTAAIWHGAPRGDDEGDEAHRRTAGHRLPGTARQRRGPAVEGSRRHDQQGARVGRAGGRPAARVAHLRQPGPGGQDDGSHRHLLRVLRRAGARREGRRGRRVRDRRPGAQ